MFVPTCEGLDVCSCVCRVTVPNVRVRWDSGDSPDQPQRDRDPADVSRTKQVTDVDPFLLMLRFFLWGIKACGTTNRTISLETL